MIATHYDCTALVSYSEMKQGEMEDIFVISAIESNEMISSG